MLGNDALPNAIGQRDFAGGLACLAQSQHLKRLQELGNVGQSICNGGSTRYVTVKSEYSAGAPSAFERSRRAGRWRGERELNGALWIACRSPALPSAPR